MKIMSKLTIKNLFKNKKNFILCLISVILSCILLFSTGLAVSTIRQNQINSVIDIYGDYHAIIYNTNTSEKNLLNDERILKYFYIFQIKDNLYSISDDFNLDLNLNGRMPNNNNEIIVNAKTATQNNLKLGDNFTIDGKNYQVVGIYTNKHFERIGLENINLTKDTESNNNSIYFIYLSSNKNMYQQLNSIADKFSSCSILPNEFVIDNLDTSYDGTQNQVYILMIMFISLILAIIVFFIIYNAFSISVNEKKKNYAMYKSIGASPKQILFSVFLESLIILAIAIPLGFLLSLGFVSFILFLINSILADFIENSLTLEIYPIFIIISFVFILISTLFATFSVAKMASSINIIEEVRQTKKFKYKKENKIVKKLFGIEGLISAKNVTRDKVKYRITTISVVIGIVLFMTATSLLSIILFSYDYDYDIRKYAYLQITGSDLENTDVNGVFDYISNLDTLEEYIYFDSNFYEFQTDIDNLKAGNIDVTYIDSTNYEKLKETYQITSDNGIIINTLETGNNVFNKEFVTLTLTPSSTHSTEQPFTVTAQVINESSFLEESYPNAFKTNIFPILILEWEEKNMDDIISVYIKADDYLKLDKEMNNLLEQNERIYYQNDQAMYHEQIVTNNCLKLVIYLILIFITFITVVSIIGTISSNLNLRRREFAVLKSLGLSNRQFNKMIFYESLMLSLKSLLFGLLIFILIAVIFIRITMIDETTFNSLLDIPLNIFISPLLICIFGVIIINYLSFLIATKKIKKDNIVDVIKTY